MGAKTVGGLGCDAINEQQKNKNNLHITYSIYLSKSIKEKIAGSRLLFLQHQ